MKILVTGGAEFMGGAVVRHIINDTDYSVANVDKLTYAGNLELLKSASYNSHYAFEQIDICDAVDLKRVFNQHEPDIVMHLAAESHVDPSIDGPGEFIQANIVATNTLLEHARAYYSGLQGNKKNNFRFHHISTDEVYSDLLHWEDNGEFNVDNPKLNIKNSTSSLFTEETAYTPSSPYSASKAASDHLVRAWQRTYGLPTLITNCSNNHGSYHFTEKLIPLVIVNALGGKPLPVYEKGNQIREWFYIEDHAHALVLVATKGKVGETYNIGGHNEKQNIEVVKTICDILDELAPPQTVIPSEVEGSSNGAKPINSYQELITYVSDRPGHDMRYAIDTCKIQRELAWTPQETFKSGIRKTVQWYSDNQAWCQHVQDGIYQRERLGSKQ